MRVPGEIEEGRERSSETINNWSQRQFLLSLFYFRAFTPTPVMANVADNPCDLSPIWIKNEPHMKWEKIHSLMEFFILSPCVYYHAVSSACARYFTFRPLTRGCFVFNALGCLLLLPSLLRFNFPDRQCFLPHSSLSNCNQIDCISCYVIYESKVIFLNTIYRHRCVLIGSTHCEWGGFFIRFLIFVWIIEDWMCGS